MSKKTLNADSITNELTGSSLFFTQSVKPVSEPEIVTDNSPSSTEQLPKSVSTPVSQITDTQPKTEEDESIKQKKDNASKQASTQTNHNDRIEAIRKTVKQVGKEIIFVRVSPEEKRAIGSIVYSFNEIYRGEGRKTSENEVGRIALNFLLEDYRDNGNNSFIARVLAALNA